MALLAANSFCSALNSAAVKAAPLPRPAWAGLAGLVRVDGDLGAGLPPKQSFLRRPHWRHCMRSAKLHQASPLESLQLLQSHLVRC